MSGAARQANKVFVSNIPWTINSSELRKYFSEYGKVSLARVMFDKENGFSRGFGYVSFESPEGLDSVLKRPHHVIEGSYVVIQPTQ